MAGKDDGKGATEVCQMNRPVQSPTCQVDSFFFLSPFFFNICLQYFFHAGSSTNWVVDMVGKPIAHYAYLTLCFLRVV